MQTKVPKAVFTIIGFFPLAVLLYALVTFGVNSPHWDDHAIRAFVDKFNAENDTVSRLAYIFAYHNEHRIVLTRLFALGIYKFQGFLDFKSMQYIGFVGLVGIWTIFALLIRRFALHPVLYFVASLCIFSFSTFENLLWGMAAIQNFWIVFLSFASFYLLSFSIDDESEFTNLIYYILAMLFCVAAIFTSGNGILTPALGFGILALKREKKYTIAWLVVFALLLILYFRGYSEIPSKIITVNLLAAQAFMMSIASAFYFDEYKIAFSYNALTVIGFSLAIFAVSLIFYPFFRAIQYKRRQPNGLLFLLSSGLFIAGTLAVVCINRIHLDPGIVLTSKYKMYSFMAILFIMIYAIYYSKKSLSRPLTLIALGISSFLYFGTYLGYFKYYALSKAENATFLLNNFSSVSNNTSYKPYPKNTLSNLDFENAISDREKIDSIALREKEILFFEFDQTESKAEIYAIAKNDSNMHFVVLMPDAQKSLIRRLFSYNDDIFRGSLDLQRFPSGIYKIYFAEKRANKTRLYDPNKTLRITGIPFNSDPKNW